MAGSYKAVLFADLVLEVLEFLGIEFYYGPADVADHMIVMRMPVGMLIDITFIGPCDPADETTLHKEAQSPVHGCPRRLGSGVFYPGIEVFGFKMTVEGVDLAKDRSALLSEFQSLPPEKITED